MYEESQQAKTNEPVLLVINERFKKENVALRELIGNVESKIHSFLNRRSPPSETGRKEEGIGRGEGDFVSALQGQLDSLEKSRMMLEQILKHLNEII